MDQQRAKLQERLERIHTQVDNEDPQGLMLRDRDAAEIQQRLETLAAADIGLMFGRIDVENADTQTTEVATTEVARCSADNASPSGGLERRYIGRIGIHEQDGAMRTLLMDWRAPQARPFYLATTLHPEGVHTRRHITTRGRHVTGVTDELITAAQVSGAEEAATEASANAPSVTSEAALLEAITRARTPHMRDIVETIAAEQDSIIRSPYRGVTVVQGAPGTGKTAVALHRAAYLLYTWREQLEKSGVLIIGPNDRFLAYISQVLPSLGETGVVLATPGSLLPGIHTRPEHSPLVREVKGSLEMLTILAQAVKTWQTIPRQPQEFCVDGARVELTPAMVREARGRARRSRRPHNLARPLFIDHVLALLTKALADTIGADPLGGENLLTEADLTELEADLREDPSVMSAVDSFWPVLTPQMVLQRLYAHPEEAAPDYDEATWEGLRATTPPPGDLGDAGDAAVAWTDADAPLLDELAELLGIVDDEQAAAEQRRAWLNKITEAQEALDILTGSASQDLDDGFAPEILMAYDLIDAETLAERQRVRDQRSTAQRAAGDMRWAFGHVIVDEAQELSAMAWRMVFRRSPNRWMTIVGDPAQTGNPAGVDSWEEALQPFVGRRWHLHQLSVNYRTPADIAEIADQLLARISPGQQPPEPLRDSGGGVVYLPRTQLIDVLAVARTKAGKGLVGVIAAQGGLSARELRQLHACNETPGAEVIAADASAAKGLEFDQVVLVEPADIVKASPMGLRDAYVAVTRTTQGLFVLHDKPLPWNRSQSSWNQDAEEPSC